MYTAAVAQPHAALRLIEGKIVPHPPLKVRGHRGGIPGEGFCRIIIQPAALVLQGLRQIPVVERDIRLDPCRKQRIDQPVIPGKTCRIDWSRALRKMRGQAIENRYAFRCISFSSAISSAQR